MTPVRALRAVGRALSRLTDRLLGRFDTLTGLSGADPERGGASVEFVLLFPAFMMVFISSFEASLMLTRQVMMERALDIVVRDIRLDILNSLTQNQIRNRVCDRARILPDCRENMLIELSEIDQLTFDLPDTNAPCVNQLTSIVESSSFVTNRAGRLILLRACYSVEPSLPLTVLAGNRTLGSYLMNNEDGTFRIVSSNIFVVED